MKYIDVELMNRVCDCKNTNLVEDEKIWQDRLTKYYEYLETINSRFPKKFFDFYTKIGMHDSILVSFQVKKNHLANSTRIDVDTLWVKNNKKFSLVFKDVKNINVSVDLLNGYCEFGDYLIGEFSEINESLLNFEFLFYDSNNSVNLVFKKLCYKTVREKDRGRFRVLTQ